MIEKIDATTFKIVKEQTVNKDYLLDTKERLQAGIASLDREKERLLAEIAAIDNAIK